MRNTAQSKAAFDEAKQYMPGGVNSPVRSFANVGGNPLFIARAEGDKIYDIDGNEYIDGACKARADRLSLHRGHPHGELGDGGDDERTAPCARIYGAQ